MVWNLENEAENSDDREFLADVMGHRLDAFMAGVSFAPTLDTLRVRLEGVVRM